MTLNWHVTMANRRKPERPSMLPPGKTGVYMGIFNFFITLPEIIASLAFGWVMNALLANNRLAAVIGGGVFLLLAAILVCRVRDTAPPELIRS